MSGIINVLYDLNNNWPKTLLLYAASGMLCLVDRQTGMVIETFPDVICDGGDPSFVYDAEDNEYIAHIGEK